MEEYAMGTGHFTPQAPQLVQDVRQGCATESVSEVMQIAATGNIKDDVGSTVVIDLVQGPILEQYGGKIGSFWGSKHNMQYTKKVQAVVETDGAAAFDVSDTEADLEKIFEGVTLARYIAKLTDGNNSVLYGWIAGVSVVGGVYTFVVNDGVTLGTQNWFQQDATAFDHEQYGSKVEIYKYATSVTLGSADTFTEEKAFSPPANPFDAGKTEFAFLRSLEDGQYGIDYKNNRFLGRKANADDTEAITYKTFSASGGVAEAVNITELGGLAMPIDETPMVASPTFLPIGGEYRAVATTYSDGDATVLQTNIRGAVKNDMDTLLSGEDETSKLIQVVQKPLTVSTYAYSVDLSAALEASSVVKNQPGNLYKLGGRIDSTFAGLPTNYYLQVLDAAVVPADGAVTHLIAPQKLVHTVGTDTPFDIDINFAGVHASVGIVWCLSSTEWVKAITGAAVSATALFK